MAFTDTLDMVIFLGGVIGFIGTLLGWRFVFDDSRTTMLVNRFGRRNVRFGVAAVYFLLALFGAYLVFGT
jgi:hypothetical protein